MNSFDGPLVIGYDGAPGGADALALGLGWSRQLSVRAVIVTVYPGPAPIGPGRVDVEWVADRRREAERLLDEALTVSSPATSVEFRAVGSGSASHGLHDVAEEVGASLIVLGSQTERRLLATSTGERVIAGAPCPVAMPPRGWRDRASHDLGRIVVAFVPTPDGREALRVAAMIALRVGARLHVVTVVAGPAEVMSYRIGEDVDRMYASAAKETFEQSIEQAMSELASDITASGEVVVGDDPVETLAGMANSSFDALFMGSRGYGPIRSVLLGGVASRLLRRVDIPAVIVPRAG
ncbi:MAG TPA: universal stress protein [Propionibacteriaceae bacterium]|nr:universal stress protein [Propionibacteriaceae bacterium]